MALISSSMVRSTPALLSSRNDIFYEPEELFLLVLIQYGFYVDDVGYDCFLDALLHIADFFNGLIDLLCVGIIGLHQVQKEQALLEYLLSHGIYL